MVQNALVSGKVGRLVEVSYGEGLMVLNRRQSFSAPILAGVAMMLMSVSAHADGTVTAFTQGTDAQQMLSNVCTFILGPFGQTLAVLGIIGIGMAWMFGRASLGLIAGVIGGIIIMFGAGFLGKLLTATS